MIDYYKHVVDPKTNEVLVSGWYHTIIVSPTYEGGTQLLDDNRNNLTAAAAHIWCEEGLQCPSIQHINGSDPNNKVTWSILNQIYRRVYGKNPTLGAEENAFLADVSNGNISVSFTVHGQPYEYKIRPELSMNIYLKKNELTNPDFSDRTYLQAAISADDQGNLSVVEYLPMPIASLSKGEFLDMIFRYSFMIFVTNDMSQGSVLNTISSPILGFIDESADGKSPYFIVTP